mgnify:CR=1 FL=1
MSLARKIRCTVSAIAVGAKHVDQLTANLEAGDWDMPDDLWRTLEERTRPTEVSAVRQRTTMFVSPRLPR